MGWLQYAQLAIAIFGAMRKAKAEGKGAGVEQFSNLNAEQQALFKQIMGDAGPGGPLNPGDRVNLLDQLGFSQFMAADVDRAALMPQGDFEENFQREFADPLFDAAERIREVDARELSGTAFGSVARNRTRLRDQELATVLNQGRFQARQFDFGQRQAAVQAGQSGRALATPFFQGGTDLLSQMLQALMSKDALVTIANQQGKSSMFGLSTFLGKLFGGGASFGGGFGGDFTGDGGNVAGSGISGAGGQM